MKHAKAYPLKKLKKSIAVFTLILFMSQISLPIWEGTAAAWA